MPVRATFLLLGWMLFAAIGCERKPSSQAHFRVMALLKTKEYDQALAEVNRRLQKDPKKLTLLENRLILLLASENPTARQEVLQTQHELDLLRAGRDVLQEQSRSRLPRVRQQTAAVLGMLRDPDGLEALQELAEDVDAEVRAEAVHALGKVNHPAAKNMLLIRLRDGYWKVRAEAAEALANLHDPSVTKQLFRTVADRDDYARMQVLDAVLKLADPSQAEIYLKQLETEEVPRKMAAALALAKIRRPEAQPVLLELLKEKHTPERLQIARGLLQLEPDFGTLENLLKVERNPQIKELLASALSSGNQKRQ